MSALVLLENTVPTFVPSSEPSPFFYFMLLLGAPLVAAAIIWGLGLGASRRKAFDDNDYLAGLRSGQPAPAVTARRAAAPAVATTQGHTAPAVEGGGSHAAPRH